MCVAANLFTARAQLTQAQGPRWSFSPWVEAAGWEGTNLPRGELRGTESRTEEAHTDPASLSARPSRPRADILMPAWPGVRWIQQEPSPQVPGLGLLLLLSLLRPLRFQRWCPSVLLRHRAMQSPGGRWEGRLGGSRSPRLCPFFALLFQK